MMDHKALLRVIETSDCKQFLDWYDNAQQECSSAVKECIDRLSSKELNAIWTVLVKWVNTSLKLVANPETQSEEKEHEMKVIGILANMAVLTIKNMPSHEPVKLLGTVQSLNENLDSITNKKTGTQICELCEMYWKLHPELELDMSTKVVHWFLKQATQPNSTVFSIKQVWNLKNSIEKWDQKHLEDSGILNLLLTCISNSKFLACAEGRKCLALLFLFGSPVVQMAQQTIKQHIPIASIADCEAIGEVYFKAWRMALSEQSRADVEFAIQDITYNAVVALREPVGKVEGGLNKIPMNKLLFHMLHAIHRQKKQRTAAILVHNLYKPILWRYLEASNGLVRANALHLFFDAFPFETGEGPEEDEALRQKQWSIIKTALLDPVPLVRTIAVQGTCRILAEYWEIIPVSIVQEFITCLLRKLLADSASVDVRASVVKGLTLMLENSQTYGLLVKMLPLTNKVLHDPSEKVRAEYVNLLTVIQKLKVSKLWEVVDVNHVILRLEADTSKSVCRKLTVLLQPFFHPKTTPDVVFQRCLHLVTENRLATRKFYQNLHTCVGIQQMAELILVIWKFLRNYIHRQLKSSRGEEQNEDEEPQPQQSKSRGKKRNRQRTSDSESSGDEKTDSEGPTEENDQNDENEDEAISESTIMGLLDVVCILLHENKTKFKTPQNLIYWNNIKGRFNKTCSLFFRYFRSSDGLRSLIFLYGLFSSSSSQHLFTYVKSQLKALDSDATPVQFAHLVDVMCNWDRGEDLLEFITEHFQASLDALVMEGGKQRKRVSFQRLTNEKPLLGLRCLQYMLQNPQNKKMIFRRNRAQIETLCDYLKKAFELLEKKPNSLGANQNLLHSAATLHVKLVLVLNCTYKREEQKDSYESSQTKIADIFEWINRVLISEEPSETIINLINEIYSASFNALLVHAIEWELCSKMITVVSQLMERVPTLSHVLLALKLAHLLIRFLYIERATGKEVSNDCDGQVLALVKLVISSSYIEQYSTEPLSEQDWNQFRNSLKQLLAEGNNCFLENQQAFRCIVEAMYGRVRKDMLGFQPNVEKPVSTSRDLPLFPGVFMGSLSNDDYLMDLVLEFLTEPLKDIDQSESIINDIAAALQLFNVFRSSQSAKAIKTKLDQVLETIEESWSQLGDVRKSTHANLTQYINEALKELKAAAALS